MRLDVIIKAAAAQVAEPKEFRRGDTSLDDFLRNCMTPSDSIDLVAAKLVEYFCLDEEGAFNNRLTGIKLALMVLGRAAKPLDGAACSVALKDLHAILMQHPSRDQIQQWARAHYGL